MAKIVAIFLVLTVLLPINGFRYSNKPRFGNSLHATNNKNINNPVFEETCDEVGITLTRYMLELVNENPEIRELESLLMSIQYACKAISNVIDRAPLTGKLGLQNGGGSINVQGEEQKTLDVITNNILKQALRYTGKVGVLASEEEDLPVSIPKKDLFREIGLRTTQFKSDVIIENSNDKFVAVFDPLDGSSNVDAGIPTGTIFGIFDNVEADECPIDFDDDATSEERQMALCIAGTLQPGKNLVAAGYCLYSSSCFLCLTVGNGVNIFTLDKSIGEFVLSHENVKIPARGKIYSFNEGNRWDWDEPLRDYVTAVQKGQGETGVRYSSRYIGSMVGDVHRTLLYGGIFGYPATVKNPDGKLRLLYEAAPMSFLMEQDLKPKSVHQRVPCIMGSPEDVLEAKSYYDACDDPDLVARCLSRL
eukprot:gene797-1547_t